MLDIRSYVPRHIRNIKVTSQMTVRVPNDPTSTRTIVSVHFTIEPSSHHEANIGEILTDGWRDSLFFLEGRGIICDTVFSAWGK